MAPTPSPISLVDNMHSDVILRDRWTAGDLDHKAVGGHLLLGKRTSTPVGVGSPYSPLKMTAPSLSQATHQSQMVSTVASLPIASEAMHHRRLDRTQSEPVRSQSSSVENNGGNRAQAAASSRYKTELCRPFGETGYCKYGEKCQFAHGCTELRNMPRHPKYKTELCRTFHTTGLCGYGTRCHFIHNADERRLPSSQTPTPVSPTTMGMPFTLRTSDDSLGPSPPSSMHGSPTSQRGTFFDESFNMGSLTVPTTDDLIPFNIISLETPPVSPVESLAGDLDSLSLSPALSSSPTPQLSNHLASLGTAVTTLCNGVPPPSLAALLDRVQGVRLPIFETFTEFL